LPFSQIALKKTTPAGRSIFHETVVDVLGEDVESMVVEQASRDRILDRIRSVEG